VYDEKMKNLLSFVVLVFFIFVQSGCSVAHMGCNLNSDCGDGLSCRSGSCVLECREDRDCEEGGYCNLTSGLCDTINQESDAGIPGDAQVDGWVRVDAATAIDGGMTIDSNLVGRLGPDGSEPTSILATCETLQSFHHTICHENEERSIEDFCLTSWTDSVSIGCEDAYTEVIVCIHSVWLTYAGEGRPVVQICNSGEPAATYYANCEYELVAFQACSTDHGRPSAPPLW
jgi:hypothetical protein